MSEDDEVIVKRLHDPVQAAMLKDLLEQEGIVVSTPGLEHRSMLGMIGSYVEIPILVRARDAERAIELIEAMEQAPDEPDEPDEADPDATGGEPADPDGTERAAGGDTAEPARPERAAGATAGPAAGGAKAGSPRLKRIAAFCSLCVSFGCGHFYARDYTRGVVLALCEAIVLVTMCGGAALAGLLLPFVLLADLVGSLDACDRYNGAERGRYLRVLGPAAPWAVVGLLALAPAVRFWAPSTLIRGAGREYCGETARCEGGARTDACVEELAGRAVRGLLEPEVVTACLRCVRERACEERFEACFDRCASLPPPAEPPPRSPLNVFAPRLPGLGGFDAPRPRAR